MQICIFCTNLHFLHKFALFAQISIFCTNSLSFIFKYPQLVCFLCTWFFLHLLNQQWENDENENQRNCLSRRQDPSSDSSALI